MNSKQKKLKKKILPVALSGLIVISATAWMTNKETQTSVNTIKVGTIDLKFTDSDNIVRKNITLQGNKSIPMTNQFAIDDDDVPTYQFALKNGGAFDLSYTVNLVVEQNTFLNTINVETDGVAQTKTVEEESTDGTAATVKTVESPDATVQAIQDYAPTTSDEMTRVPIYTGTIKAGETIEYDALQLYLDQSMVLEQYQNKSAVFHLEVVAEQANAQNNTTSTFTLNFEDGTSLSTTQTYVSYPNSPRNYGLIQDLQDSYEEGCLDSVLGTWNQMAYDSSTNKVYLLKYNDGKTGVIAKEILTSESKSIKESYGDYMNMSLSFWTNALGNPIKLGEGTEILFNGGGN